MSPEQNSFLNNAHYQAIKQLFDTLLTQKHKTRNQVLYLKMLNQRLAEIEHIHLKRAVVGCYPVKLTVCPTNICNLQCALCPSGCQSPGRKPGRMKIATFHTLLEDIGEPLRRIDLYNWGEPFLNKDLFKMIKYAHRYHVKVSVSTNLNQLSNRQLDALFESELDELIFSLDGVTQASVEAYQKGSLVARVFENLKRIQERKYTLGALYPKLTWRFIINKHNAHEIEQAKSLRKILSINRLELSPVRCDMGREIMMTDQQQFEAVKDWLPEDNSLAMYDYEHQRKKHRFENTCNWLWSQSAVNWNGSVSPCCAVWEEASDFGNILDHPFSEIWNNTHYQQARNTILGKPDQGPATICAICKKNKAQIL